MQGIVIHMGGRVRRSIAGRGNTGRLSVVPLTRAGFTSSQTNARPVRFVFYEGGRQIASSSKVILARGRRYPGVEHWFVLPEAERWAEAFEPLRQPADLWSGDPGAAPPPCPAAVVRPPAGRLNLHAREGILIRVAAD